MPAGFKGAPIQQAFFKYGFDIWGAFSQIATGERQRSPELFGIHFNAICHDFIPFANVRERPPADEGGALQHQHAFTEIFCQHSRCAQTGYTGPNYDHIK
jgi:hypothetical protein